MANANGTTTKLEEAARRWGAVEVLENHPAPRPAAAVRFVGRARVSRVVEQVRDISAFKLER